MTATPFELFGEQYYLRQGFWMLCIPVLACMVLLSPWIILQQVEGRRERAIARARKLGRWLLLTVALYITGGMLDRTLAAYCSVGDEGRSPDGLYELETCYMAGRGQDATLDGIARLRSTKDGTVLAEAEFQSPSFSWIYWDERYVHVGVGDGSVNITLPPTWLDRLRAKLP